MCCYSFHPLTRVCAVKVKVKVTTVQCRAGGLCRAGGSFGVTTFLSWDGEWFGRIWYGAVCDAMRRDALRADVLALCFFLAVRVCVCVCVPGCMYFRLPSCRASFSAAILDRYVGAATSSRHSCKSERGHSLPPHPNRQLLPPPSLSPFLALCLKREVIEPKD